jgi:hypothetical protein
MTSDAGRLEDLLPGFQVLGNLAALSEQASGSDSENYCCESREAKGSPGPISFLHNKCSQLRAGLVSMNCFLQHGSATNPMLEQKTFA